MPQPTTSPSDMKRRINGDGNNHLIVSPVVVIGKGRKDVIESVVTP